MNVDKVISGMFFLILVFILVSRASNFNSIIYAGGNFITQQTQALQGVSTNGNSHLVQ